jgi:hypothetical protein
MRQPLGRTRKTLEKLPPALGIAVELGGTKPHFQPVPLGTLEPEPLLDHLARLRLTILSLKDRWAPFQTHRTDTYKHTALRHNAGCADTSLGISVGHKTPQASWTVQTQPQLPVAWEKQQGEGSQPRLCL